MVDHPLQINSNEFLIYFYIHETKKNLAACVFKFMQILWIKNSFICAEILPSRKQNRKKNFQFKQVLFSYNFNSIHIRLINDWLFCFVDQQETRKLFKRKNFRQQQQKTGKDFKKILITKHFVVAQKQKTKKMQKKNKNLTNRQMIKSFLFHQSCHHHSSIDDV